MIKYGRTATTLLFDTREEIEIKVQEVFSIFIKENDIKLDDIKVVQISITDDIHSYNPCTALRISNPNLKACLFTSLEPSIINSLKLAIRMLITFESAVDNQVKHIYMHGAKTLRKEFAYSNVKN